LHGPFLRNGSPGQKIKFDPSPADQESREDGWWRLARGARDSAVGGMHREWQLVAASGERLPAITSDYF
jgi:hypothetical protein